MFIKKIDNLNKYINDTPNALHIDLVIKVKEQLESNPETVIYSKEFNKIFDSNGEIITKIINKKQPYIKQDEKLKRILSDAKIIKHDIITSDIDVTDNVNYEENQINEFNKKNPYSNTKIQQIATDPKKISSNPLNNYSLIKGNGNIINIPTQTLDGEYFSYDSIIVNNLNTGVYTQGLVEYKYYDRFFNDVIPCGFVFLVVKQCFQTVFPT